MTSEELERAAVATLSEQERSRAVVYVDDRVLKPGEDLEVDGERVRIDASTIVAFADLEPGVNWGHRARYLLVESGSGKVRPLEAQFPPFLRGMRPGLRVIYRAPDVPDWAVATD